MNEFTQLPALERALYFRQASEKMPIPLPAAVIEKDFWVCWTLKILNELPELTGNITLKGGTSLSKAWGMIDRFSEDLDLAVNRKVFGLNPPFGPENAKSNAQRKIRLSDLEKKSESFIKEVVIPKMNESIRDFLDPKEFKLKSAQKGNEVTIEFGYPGTFKNELGSLLPVVLIELVPRADDIPNKLRKITPIVFAEFHELLGDVSFQIPTLTPERTFLEKLLIIHETLEGFNKGSERKSRHYYDLFKLYHAGVFDRVKMDSELLNAVVQHRHTFFRYNTLDYSEIPTIGIRAEPLKENLVDWRSDYLRTRVMIYNKIPSFEELMEFAKKLEVEFNTWVKENSGDIR